MEHQFLPAGTIVNTHGIRGEMRLLVTADSPNFLLPLKRLYINGVEHKVKASRVHKSFLLIELEGVEDVNAAMCMKNKAVEFNRDDIALEPGSYYLADLVGLEVRDENGAVLGTLKDVLRYPTQDVYLVQGERELMIPAVDEFVREKNLAEGFIVVRLIEGM